MIREFLFQACYQRQTLGLWDALLERFRGDPEADLLRGAIGPDIQDIMSLLDGMETKLKTRGLPAFPFGP